MIQQQVKKTLNKFGDNVIAQAKKNLKDDGKNSSGALYNSLDYIVDVYPNSFSFFIVMEQYGEYVDGGRRPGKFPPVDAIRGWIKQKPIKLRDLKTGQFMQKNEKNINSVAFLIGRSIKEKGIKPTYFLTDAFNKYFKELGDDITEAYGLEIDKLFESSLSNLNKKYKR